MFVFDNKNNFSNEKKTYFFVKIFGKPLSKCTSMFRLCCLPERKRRKVSLNLGDLRWFCLLSSMNERIAVGVSPRAAFYLLLHLSAPFSCNFVKDAARLLVLISFNPNKYFIIYMNKLRCGVISS